MAEKQSANNLIKVIRSDKLSSLYDNRFVVIDVNTGEVLDNAQGYGYKTKQKAFAAFCYKRDHGESDIKKKKAIKNTIKKWLEKHQDFSDLLDMYFLEIAKGEYGEGFKFDEQFLKDVLRKNEIELKSFSVKQLLEYYGIKK